LGQPSHRITILLSNLRAEGGPALAADLCAEWLAGSISPELILLNENAMDMADRFEVLGVPIQVLGVDDTSLRSYPQLFFRLYRLFRRSRPDALVSILSGVHGVIFAAAVLAGVRRRIVHVGGYPWHWKVRQFWKYRLLMRLAAPLTSDVVCVTEHVHQGVETYFGRVASRVHVIANGVDLDRFAFARQRAGSITGSITPNILMVGRLDSDKDHATLLRALALLRSRDIPVRLKLAGDGALVDALVEETGRLGLSDCVEFLGARRDVPELLAAADVFAFSVKPEEGLGIALVEAMAAEVPVIATDVAACREVLADGDCGLLVPPNDANALANAILRLVTQPAEASALAAKARKRAEFVYNRREMARRYAALCGAV
jgi:glycosyltransferase involved in cell wall biosynthesis